MIDFFERSWLFTQVLHYSWAFLGVNISSASYGTFVMAPTFSLSGCHMSLSLENIPHVTYHN